MIQLDTTTSLNTDQGVKVTSIGPAGPSGQGMTFNSSVNIISSVNADGEPYQNNVYNVNPLRVYGQAGMIPPALYTTSPPFLYQGAPTAHYSLKSFNAFTPSPGPAPGGGGYNAGSHMAFYSSPTAANRQSAGSYAPAPTANWANQGINATGGAGINQPGLITGVAYSTPSDYRLKKDVTPVENGLDYIMPLRPRRFKWKETGAEIFGFIAHEIQEDTPPFLADTITSGVKDATRILGNFIDKNGDIVEVGGQNLFPKPSEEILKRMREEEGQSWVFVKEEMIPQMVGSKGLASPIVASIQQLKKIYDEQELEIKELETRMSVLKQRKQTQ